jgi:hypothetical protein
VDAITNVDIEAILRWLEGTPATEFATLFQSESAAQKIAKRQKGFKKALKSLLMDAFYYFELFRRH